MIARRQVEIAYRTDELREEIDDAVLREDGKVLFVGGRLRDRCAGAREHVDVIRLKELDEECKSGDVATDQVRRVLECGSTDQIQLIVTIIV